MDDLSVLVKSILIIKFEPETLHVPSNIWQLVSEVEILLQVGPGLSH